MMMLLSSPTTSWRSSTMCRHQSWRMLRLSATPSGPKSYIALMPPLISLEGKMKPRRLDSETSFSTSVSGSATRRGAGMLTGGTSGCPGCGSGGASAFPGEVDRFQLPVEVVLELGLECPLEGGQVVLVQAKPKE